MNAQPWKPSISDLLDKICQLQLPRNASETSSVAERGILIRHTLPDEISPDLASLAASAQIPASEIIIVGKDGAGKKSHIPWVRIASREHSPAATIGWYIVYLWRRDGAGVYLSLIHGSTTYKNGSFVSRPKNQVRALVEWARAQLKDSGVDHAGLVQTIDLASSGKLAGAYERSCPMAIYYPSDQIPERGELIADIRRMMKLLGLIYEKERLGQAKHVQNPEVRDATNTLESISSPSSRRGQGPGLTSAERRVVELHAMRMAAQHLAGEGYDSVDCSAKESFDLLATKGAEQLKIEVKGTTGEANEILLTANEVRLHEASFGANGLIVVSGISLRRGSAPEASGGTLSTRIPWKIDRENLSPLAYSYRLVIC